MISSVARAACHLNKRLDTTVGGMLLDILDDDAELALMTVPELKVALAEAFAAGREERERKTTWGPEGAVKRSTTLSFQETIIYSADGTILRVTNEEL